jgi:hypothetical protein
LRVPVAQPRSRLVAEKAAAAYVGLDLATFRHWVTRGRLPKPILDCGLYDLHAIDAALDRISGIKSPSNALDAWLRESAHAG